MLGEVQCLATQLKHCTAGPNNKPTPLVLCRGLTTSQTPCFV